VGLIDQLILPLFSHDIGVDVAPDRFTFTCRNSVITIATFVLAQRTGNGPRVLAVGEDVPDASQFDVVRVDLFSNSDPPPGVADRFEFLSGFMRYAFIKATGRRTLVNPAVTIRGIHSLTPFTHGYERSLIGRAVEEAGARTIEFA